MGKEGSLAISEICVRESYRLMFLPQWVCVVETGVGANHSCKMMEVQEKEDRLVMSSLGTSEEAFDEELSVLPRHTKVIVTGNNRTKSVLVGLHGVVKKAVGLGGWHWLVLTNGLEVKLQRNALSVLEPPSGLEEDDDSDEGRSNVEDYPKPCKVRVRPQKHNSTMRGGGVQKWPVADAYSTGPKSNQRLLKVNLSKLETAALLRYWRRFELVEAGPNSSKEQLLDAVERHFSAQQLDEFQVIARFMQAAKRLKTVYE